MRNGILGLGLVLLGVCAWSSSACGYELPSSQTPPNRPIQINHPEPAAMPPLTQALHVEEVPALPPQPVQADAGTEPGQLRLPPKGQTKQEESLSATMFNFQSNRTASIAASLLVVIGLFLIFAWVGKKNMKPGTGKLSKEIIQVLGKSQLSGKQQLELVRVGQKLLLLCVTATSVETLTEITDPMEVERLLTIVRQDSPGSMTSTFQEVLTQLGQKPARGFLEA